MPATVTWGNNEYSVLRLTLSSRWQWADLQTAKSEIEAMLDPLDHPVDILACGDLEHWLPLNFNENMLKLTRNIHPNVNRVIIVHSNPLFEQLFQLFVRLVGGIPFEFVFVKSLEAAQAYLMEPAPV